jgi:hypothetical protein
MKFIKVAALAAIVVSGSAMAGILIRAAGVMDMVMADTVAQIQP